MDELDRIAEASHPTGAEDLGPPPIPSLAAIAGHPIHPAVMPLPVGALVFALAADLAYARTHDRFWTRAARTLTGAGIVTGLFAASVGAIDFFGRDQIREHGEAWGHAGGNAVAIGLAAASYALRPDDGRPAPAAAVILSALCTAILGLTGWLGGELTFRHRVGVIDG